MNIEKILAATRTLGKPKDWDNTLDGECVGLPIRDGLFNGSSAMYSAWKPDAEDLAALNRGACVILAVCGSMHPPVSVMVGENCIEESKVPA